MYHNHHTLVDHNSPGYSRIYQGTPGYILQDVSGYSGHILQDISGYSRNCQDSMFKDSPGYIRILQNISEYSKIYQDSP